MDFLFGVLNNCGNNMTSPKEFLKKNHSDLIDAVGEEDFVDKKLFTIEEVCYFMSKFKQDQLGHLKGQVQAKKWIAEDVAEEYGDVLPEQRQRYKQEADAYAFVLSLINDLE